MLKILYGASLGLVAFMLVFLAPTGGLMTTSAAPDRVKRDTSGPGVHGSSSSRSSRSSYIFISGGGYGK